MMKILTVALVAPALGLAPSMTPSQRSVVVRTALHMVSTTGISEEESSSSSSMQADEPAAPAPIQARRSTKMSQALPFLACPPVLQESDLSGNMGFDPLEFSRNKEQLWEYREAEIKHARLAMLAAVGWPVSELLDRSLAAYFQAPAMLDDGDRVPSVLNGGMAKIDPRYWGFCLGLCAAIDMYGVAKARRGGNDYFPGNLGFDPLGLFPSHKEGQENMKLAEIKHGRTAMMGVLGYVMEEYTTKMAVVEDTPILFQPITETVEEAIVGAVAAEGAMIGAL